MLPLLLYVYCVIMKNLKRLVYFSNRCTRGDFDFSFGNFRLIPAPAF